MKVPNKKQPHKVYVSKMNNETKLKAFSFTRKIRIKKTFSTENPEKIFLYIVV